MFCMLSSLNLKKSKLFRKFREEPGFKRADITFCLQSFTLWAEVVSVLWCVVMRLWGFCQLTPLRLTVVFCFAKGWDRGRGSWKKEAYYIAGMPLVGSIHSVLFFRFFPEYWKYLLRIREVIKKKNGKKAVRLTAWVVPPSPSPEAVRKMWNFLTFIFDFIFWLYTTQNEFYPKKIFFDHWPPTHPPKSHLETFHDIHGFSCLGTVKKALKIH